MVTLGGNLQKYKKQKILASGKGFFPPPSFGSGRMVGGKKKKSRKSFCSPLSFYSPPLCVCVFKEPNSFFFFFSCIGSALRCQGSLLQHAAFLQSWHLGFSCCGAQALECRDSVVAAHRLDCPLACGILVPQPGIKPVSPALEGGFLTTGPPGKSPQFDS